ncbi:SDR family NAD(P)-dependent oxidoreductase [Teichococcus vastitatis]|uniref:SDR family NAD(P)-dependent oxidoreductase n=1 Tax=Teichococcus vastitatis TaxID=2307076 RepID=UPI001EE43C8C|nr:SDR family NAD(P)-dependent oxidoreductase [Pseudoroseomonas vastitatis]
MAQHHLGGATVVITGASSGIGQATAEAFAREGARLVLAARGPEALEQVAARCRELGAAVAAVPTDITDTEAVQALAERAVQFGCGIEVWVSVVGTGAVGRFHEVPMAAHEQVIRANLLGHMNDAHAVLPVFLRQERGVLININSVGGYASVPFAAAYGASKFGLRGFTEPCGLSWLTSPTSMSATCSPPSSTPPASATAPTTRGGGCRRRRRSMTRVAWQPRCFDWRAGPATRRWWDPWLR